MAVSLGAIDILNTSGTFTNLTADGSVNGVGLYVNGNNDPNLILTLGLSGSQDTKDIRIVNGGFGRSMSFNNIVEAANVTLQNFESSYNQGSGASVEAVFFYNADGITIRNGWVHHNIQGLYFANGAQNNTAQNIIAEYNTIDNLKASLDAQGNIFEYCIARYGGDSWVAAWQTATGRTAYGNDGIGVAFHITAGDSTPNQVRYSLIYGNEGPGFEMTGGTVSYVTNNVISQNGYSPGSLDLKGGVYISSSAVANSRIQNNIFYDNSPAEIYHSAGGVNYLAQLNAMDYNQYYHPDDSNQFYVDMTNDSSPNPAYMTWAQYQSAMGALGTPQETHSKYSDPVFNNVSSSDFTLSALSQAINGGISISGLTTDYAGNTVPQGASPDIGAYEFLVASASSSLAQYKTDGVTAISSGAFTNESTVTLKFVMSSANSTDSLTPQVEVIENGASFNNSVTNTGTAVTYSGSTVTGVVTVTGLTSGQTYHWQARTSNAAGQSAWVAKGGNPDFRIDTTAPTGGSITFTDGYYGTASVALVADDGTDSGSGIDTSTRTIQRRSAALSNGVCGSYGSFATISPSGSYPNYTDDSVTLDSCYQFQYLVSDAIGNQATYTSSNTAKVRAQSSGNANPDSVPQSVPAPPQCGDQKPGDKVPWLYSAVAQNGNEILLSFGEAADPLDHYALEFGTKSGDYPYGATNIGDKGLRTYLVKSLQPNTTYYFRIRGGNGCATGGWSNEISAKTKGLVSFNQLDFSASTLEPVESVKEAAPSSTSCKTYTVKPNDTLWGIAASELSDGSRYTEISEQNKSDYPSLETSNNLEVGWELRINCSATEISSQEASQDQEIGAQGGYVVNIKVADKNEQPVEGAKVTIHSKVQETTTDADGVARFENVEPGDHRVLIAYNNFEGEQSINLSGDVKEFNLNVTVEQKNVLTSPLVMTVIGGMALVILILVFLLLRAKRKN